VVAGRYCPTTPSPAKRFPITQVVVVERSRERFRRDIGEFTLHAELRGAGGDVRTAHGHGEGELLEAVAADAGLGVAPALEDLLAAHLDGVRHTLEGQAVLVGVARDDVDEDDAAALGGFAHARAQ
jgi:hypothetical protein